jgi:molecular chaperone GrpE
MTPEDMKAPPSTVLPSDIASIDAPGAEGISDEAARLRQQLEEAQAEGRSNYDRFLRERAELENFKKRLQREQAEALRFASAPLIRDLLPLVDNLERAIEHAPDDGQSVLDGIRLVLKSFAEVLERHGVRRIDAVGKPFDPSHHEAMAQIESVEYEPNHVIEQHHPGYLLHDRLLRPALVTVSTRKCNGAVETGQGSD